MKRWAFLLYGVACHVLFLATYAYMALFVGNLLLAKSIDEPAGGPVGWAVFVNLLLLAAFGFAAFDHGAAGVQGSLDARRSETD